MDELELYILRDHGYLTKCPKLNYIIKYNLYKTHMGFLVEKLNGYVLFDNKCQCHVI